MIPSRDITGATKLLRSIPGSPQRRQGFLRFNASLASLTNVGRAAPVRHSWEDRCPVPVPSRLVDVGGWTDGWTPMKVRCRCSRAKLIKGRSAGSSVGGTTLGLEARRSGRRAVANDRAECMCHSKWQRDAARHGTTRRGGPSNGAFDKQRENLKFPAR